MKATTLSQRERAEKFLHKCKNTPARGIRFSLTMTQFDKLFEDYPVCFYTGEQFANREDITVERLDANKDYTVDNCVLVTAKANVCKEILDTFERSDLVSIAAKIRIMRKSLYRLEKRQREINKLQAKKAENSPLKYVTAAMNRAKK